MFHTTKVTFKVLQFALFFRFCAVR